MISLIEINSIKEVIELLCSKPIKSEILLIKGGDISEGY